MGRFFRSPIERFQIWLKTEGHCNICGIELDPNNWHCDHIIPWGLTQDTSIENGQPLCPDCNEYKSDKYLSITGCQTHHHDDDMHAITSHHNGAKNDEQVKSSEQLFVENESMKNASLLLSSSMKLAFEADKCRYENSNNICRYTNLTAARIGQRGAINCAVEKFTKGKNIVSLCLPTRYGKTDVGLAIINELREQSKISGALFLVPNIALRDQVVDRKKYLKSAKRYGLNVKRIPTGFKPREAGFASANIGNSFCLGGTIQYFTAGNNKTTNLDLWCETFDNRKRQGHEKVLVVIDESHFTSTENIWGEIAEKFVDHHCLVLVVTATPERQDGKTIPGFFVEELSSEETVERISRPGSQEGYLNVQMYDSTRKVLRLHPDYAYSFREAWDEGGVLCKLVRDTFDVKVEIDGVSKTLSEITSIEESRKILRRVVRDPRAIEMGVKKLVDTITDIRMGSGRHISGMIFCGNKLPDVEGIDVTDEQADQHANEIKAILERLYPDMSSVIVTTEAFVDSDQTAAEQIGKFKDGDYDIIIAKQMASVGLDIDHLKVILDLSSIRSSSAWLQRVMRSATIYNDITVGYYITPNDIKGDALWNRMVANEGGEMTRTDRGELLETTEVEITEKDAPFLEISDVFEGIKSTTASNDSQYTATKEKFLRENLPTLLHMRGNESIDITYKMWEKYQCGDMSFVADLAGYNRFPQALQEMHDLSKSKTAMIDDVDIVDDAPTKTLTEQYNDVVKSFNDSIRFTAGILIERHGINQLTNSRDAKSNIMKQLYVSVYERAGLKRSTKLKDITSMDDLEHLRQCSIDMRREINSGKFNIDIAMARNTKKPRKVKGA